MGEAGPVAIVLYKKAGYMARQYTAEQADSIMLYTSTGAGLPQLSKR